MDKTIRDALHSLIIATTELVDDLRWNGVVARPINCGTVVHIFRPDPPKPKEGTNVEE